MAIRWKSCMLIFKMLGIEVTNNFAAVKSAYDKKMRLWQNECDELISILRRVDLTLDTCSKQLTDAEALPYKAKLSSCSTGMRAYSKQRINAEMRAEEQRQNEQAAIRRHCTDPTNTPRSLVTGTALALEGSEKINVRQKINADRTWSLTQITQQAYQRVIPIKLSAFDKEHISSFREKIEENLQIREELKNKLDEFLELRRGLRELFSKVDTPETLQFHLAQNEQKVMRMQDLREVNPLDRTITTPEGLERVVRFPLSGRPISEQPQLCFFGVRNRRHLGSADYSLPELSEPDSYIYDSPEEEHELSRKSK